MDPIELDKKSYQELLRDSELSPHTSPLSLFLGIFESEKGCIGPRFVLDLYVRLSDLVINRLSSQPLLKSINYSITGDSENHHQ